MQGEILNQNHAILGKKRVDDGSQHTFSVLQADLIHGTLRARDHLPHRCAAAVRSAQKLPNPDFFNILQRTICHGDPRSLGKAAPQDQNGGNIFIEFEASISRLVIAGKDQLMRRLTFPANELQFHIKGILPAAPIGAFRNKAFPVVSKIPAQGFPVR